MSSSGAADFESLLQRAFAPVEPPSDLSERLEDRLTRITALAVDELESWELESMRDPRNWTRAARPIAAGVIAAGAGTAVVLLRARRNAKRSAKDRLLRR
jgi:hypothetical protein